MAMAADSFASAPRPDLSFTVFLTDLIQRQNELAWVILLIFGIFCL
jgi:hypothetical protein